MNDRRHVGVEGDAVVNMATASSHAFIYSEYLEKAGSQA